MVKLIFSFQVMIVGCYSEVLLLIERFFFQAAKVDILVVKLLLFLFGLFTSKPKAQEDFSLKLTLVLKKIAVKVGSMNEKVGQNFKIVIPLKQINFHRKKTIETIKGKSIKNHLVSLAMHSQSRLDSFF